MTKNNRYQLQLTLATCKTQLPWQHARRTAFHGW